MNLYNLFEDDNRTPNPNYAEELAYQIFKAAPNLDTTGAADEVLDYAYDLVVNDFGKTKANALFAYDEDFDSDLVNAYLDLQMNQQAVDKKQVNEVDPRNFDSDEDYYAALNAPAKRRSAPSDYPYSPEEDDAYFREIFRKKREAAKKAAQDKESGVAESRMSELDAEYEDYKKLSPREFFNMYRITKQAWLTKYKSMLPVSEADAQVNGQEVDASVVVGKLYDIIDHAEDSIKNADFDRQVQYATTVRDRAVKALNMIKQGGNSPEAASAAFRYMQTGNQGVQESKKKVNESVFLKEDRQRIYEQWNRVGTKLVEYRLTPQQIQDIFSQVEQTSTQAGGNRTMVGRGVDKATELNNAWEGLKDQIQQSHPVKGFDDLYDKAAAKLKSATGGDEGVMQYVNKYRTFAKEHPYIQSAVYAALIAAAGLSGAGLGGAGALGLLKMTDRLLQGDKASSALYKGAKTGALAMAAHSIADYFKNPNAQIPTGTPARLPDGSEYVVQKGDTLSAIAQKNGVSVKDLMAANSGQTVPTGDQITWNDPNAFTDVNPMGDAVPPGTGAEQTYSVRPKLTNPDVLTPGQKINVPGSLGPTQTYADGVGTAADTWDKVKGGEYTPSEISRNQAAKWNLPGAGEYTPPGGKIPASQAPMFDPTGGAGQDPAFDDGASQLKPSADFVKVGANAPTGASMSPDYLKQIINGTNPRPMLSPDQAQAALDWQAQNGGQAVSAATNAGSGAGKGFSKEYLQSIIDGTHPRPMISPDQAQKMLDAQANQGINLKESQIYTMFDSVVAGQKKLNEGMWDSVKGAAARAGQWAQTKGHNLTTKITLDKLLQAWNKARKPMDSEGVKQVLVNAGVSPEVINSVYTSMKIPTTAPAQQTGVQGRVEPTMTAAPATAQPATAQPATAQPATAQPAAKTTPPATIKTQAPGNTSAWNYNSAAKAAGVAQTAQKPAAQATALPTWADPKSSEYVGRREVARRMAAQPTQPAAPKTPQWGVSTGAYSTQAAKQQPGTKPVATPSTKPGLAAPKLTPAEYINKIGVDELPESKMSELDAEYQDYKKLSPREFFNMYRITKQQWLAKYKDMLPQQGVAEADKKDDEAEPNVRDVVLQRAISRAKADFPTAGSGIEALAKDFMRSQDQDQQSFDQLRQAERKQDQMLGQIAKIDQEQEQEIQDIENQNSTLSSRLQQLQNVNGELEKKLAAMSGRREKRKADKEKTKTTAEPATSKVDVRAPADTDKPAKAEPKAKAAKAPNVSYTIKPAQANKKPDLTAKAEPSDELDPGALAFAQMTPNLGSQQKSLDLDTDDNVLPAINTRRQDSRYDADRARYNAAKANATDADVRYGRELADRALQSVADAGKASPDYPEAERLRAMKKPTVENDQEAEYSNKYQDMVKRMGQKAREQEKSKPVDIKDLARRLAAIEASRKD